MNGKNILSLSLILTFITVMMMDIRTVQAAPYEYELYVDDFKPWMSQLAVSGVSPWLDAVGDNNYIEGTSDGDMMGNFTFEDINLPPDEVITKVVLEGYTRGLYNQDVEFDVYTVHAWPDIDWLGSLYATGTPAGSWVTPRWIHKDASEIDRDLLTQSGLNSLEVMLYFYDPTGSGGTGNILDALRLRVYTAISATCDIDPDTVNFRSGTKFLKCTITLPPGFFASDIDTSTIMLDWAIPIDSFKTPTDGSLEVKFNMTDVKSHIALGLLGDYPPPPPGVDVTLTITFILDGTPFACNDTITVKE